MGANFLNLNESKTKLVVFGKTSPAFSTNALGSLASNIRPSVRNLGVIFDSTFKFEQQVSAVVRKSFFHLRILAETKAYLPQSDLERESSMPTSHHNWTTVMLSTLASINLSSATCSWFRTQPPDSSPVLKNVNISPQSWLHSTGSPLLPHRFQTPLDCIQISPWSGPTYLSVLLHHHSPSRALWSADQLRLEEPRTRSKTRGDRAFAVAAPRLWNCLPLHILAAQSLNVLKSLLKTHLYSLAFG